MNIDGEANLDRIRDVPFLWWITGAILLSIGTMLLRASFALITSEEWASVFFVLVAGSGIVLIVFGLGMVVSVPVITIRIDRMSQTLELSSRSLLKSQLKKFQLQDIASVDAEQSEDTDGRAYRLVITERDGTVTPLRPHYGPWNRKLQRRLWEIVGVRGAIGSPRSLTGVISILTGQDEMAIQAMQHRQKLVTKSCEYVSESADVPSGIHTVGIGGMPVTQWFSPNFKMQGAFLFIAQKSTSTSLMNRLCSRGMLGKKVLLASMATHGLSDIDAPGKLNAQVIDVPGLEPHFACIASDEPESRRILNRSLLRTLVDWAERHPIRGIRNVPVGYRITDSRDLGQLAVLLGPKGVYVITAGTLSPEPLAELGDIGMTLIESQTS